MSVGFSLNKPEHHLHPSPRSCTVIKASMHVRETLLSKHQQMRWRPGRTSEECK